MMIKRYIGKSTQEAMVKLRRELGNDAVILHTRKIRKPGITGFFKKPLIEIVAALDDNKKTRQGEVKRKKTKNITEELNKNLFLKKENNSNDLTSEIKQLKYMVKDVIERVDKKYEEDLPLVLKKYKINLIKKGVAEEVVNNLLKKVTRQINIEMEDEPTLKKVIKSSILDYLGEPLPIELNGKQKVVFFVGPTGVGKTTTLAKIAANYALQQREKVGLITADTYRIAAVEQLKTYSEILGVPIKIIYETKEIYSALSNLDEKELILIDTAGRNHKDSKQINEIKELVESIDNKEVYLVLSATTDWNTTKSIIKRYDIFNDYKIIFTKLDESDNLGIVLNTKYYSNRPLSYFANGQNVPEDIEIANINEISKHLIGEI